MVQRLLGRCWLLSSTFEQRNSAFLCQRNPKYSLGILMCPCWRTTEIALSQWIKRVSSGCYNTLPPTSELCVIRLLARKIGLYWMICICVFYSISRLMLQHQLGEIDCILSECDLLIYADSGVKGQWLTKLYGNPPKQWQPVATEHTRSLCKTKNGTPAPWFPLSPQQLHSCDVSVMHTRHEIGICQNAAILSQLSLKGSGVELR